MISVFALFACGESTPGPAGDAGGTPPVGAAAGETAGTPEPPPASVAVDPNVQSCLDLIRQSKFEAALPVCLAALDVDPDNQQVRDAVETARAESAKLAAAQAAGQAAAGGTAAEAAASKLGEMTGGAAE
jgi:hypothetical protein